MVYKQLAPDYYEWQEFTIMMTAEAEIPTTRLQHILCVPGLMFTW